MGRDYSSLFVTTDDFENPDSSPVPPYDRNWRHPAEVADTERARHLGTAPPLGRRLTALTVIACVLTSLAVLTVAIPKGIEEYAQAEQDEIVIPTSTVVPPKGSGIRTIVGLRGLADVTTALSLGNRRWLVATEDITPRRFPASYGAGFTVIREDKEIGLSVIQLKAGEEVPAIETADFAAELTSEELEDCNIVDAFQAHTLAAEPSLTSEESNDFHPVNMETSIKGIAVAVNKANKIVGVLVRKGHAQWAVSRDALLRLAER